MDEKTKKKILQIPNFLVVIKCLEESPTTMTAIQYRTQMAYSFLQQAKTVFLELGLIEYHNETKIVRLTEKGNELAQVVDFMCERLGIDIKDINEYRIKRTPKEVRHNVNN